MKIIDWKVLKTLIPYCRQQILRMEKAGKFPLRVQLGPCRVGWVYDEVMEWLRARIEARSSEPEQLVLPYLAVDTPPPRIIAEGSGPLTRPVTPN